MIRLLHSHLDFDIRQHTFRAARTKTDDPAILEIAQLDTSSSDSAYIRRWILSGVADLHFILRNYLLAPSENKNTFPEGDKPTTTTTYTDELKTSLTQYDFLLNKAVDEQALALLMHRFIVRYALHEWAVTHDFTNLAKQYQTELEQIKSDIKSTLLRITTPKKFHEPKYRPPQPLLPDPPQQTPPPTTPTT